MKQLTRFSTTILMLVFFFIQNANGQINFDKLKFNQFVVQKQNDKRITGTNQLPLSADYFEWANSMNFWEHRHNLQYKFYSSGKIKTITAFSPTTNLPVKKDSLIYDQDKNLELLANFSWVNNAWKLQFGYHYLKTFNAAGKITEQLNRHGSTNWSDLDKFVFHYDQADRLIKRERFFKINNVWQLDSDILYTYTTNALLPEESISRQYVNGVVNPSNQIRKTNFTWHNFEKSQPTAYVEKIWNNGAWQDQFRYTISYDTLGGSTEIQEFYSGSWANFKRRIILYNAEGELTKNSFEGWNTANAGWQVSSFQEWQFTHLYNADLTIAETVRQYRDDSNPQFRNSTKYVYYYSPVSSVHLPEQNYATNVFPNPTSGFLNITLQNQPSVNIQISDLTGRIVKTETLSATNSRIDISSLPKGLYLLNIQTEKESQTFKIVKQ